MIDRETVLKVAQLAKLELSDEEVELFSKQLADILNFVDQMKEVDTEGVPPFVLDYGETPMREDIPQPSLPKEEIEKNAPEFENGYFVVPRIFETE
jgi:aspartyl-tRNA(Asn)/glutamyl-tRNA(Gln) amidotransferase subunit C